MDEIYLLYAYFTFIKMAIRHFKQVKTFQTTKYDFLCRTLKRFVTSKLQITAFLFKPTPLTVLMVFKGMRSHQAEQRRGVKLWPRHSDKTPEGLPGQKRIENWFNVEPSSHTTGSQTVQIVIQHIGRYIRHLTF